MTETSQESDLIPPGCGLYLAWLFATTLGAFLGWMLGWRASYIAPGGLSILIIAGGMGLTVGVAQWMVLRSHLKGAGSWIGFSLLGWVLGFPLGAELANQLGLTEIGFGLLVGISVGASLGVLQWSFLRRRVSRAGGWIPASIFAWASSLIYYRPGATWLGLLFGLLVGIVTGVVLLWLLYRPTAD